MVVLDGASLTIDSLSAVAEGRDEVALAPAARDRMAAAREVVEEALRSEAAQAHRQGHQMAHARTPGSLVERDAMVFHTARRLRALDAEYEGLVFGRLDLTDGEVRHIGRLGLRDAEYEPLVVDWRAPGAAAFYQATAEEPMGVLRRRVIRCSGPKVLDIEDDLIDASGGHFVTQPRGDLGRTALRLQAQRTDPRQPGRNDMDVCVDHRPVLPQARGPWGRLPACRSASRLEACPTS